MSLEKLRVDVEWILVRNLDVQSFDFLHPTYNPIVLGQNVWIGYPYIVLSSSWMSEKGRTNPWHKVYNSRAR